jgi:hypothetical protein
VAGWPAAHRPAGAEASPPPRYQEAAGPSPSEGEAARRSTSATSRRGGLSLLPLGFKRRRGARAGFARCRGEGEKKNKNGEA